MADADENEKNPAEDYSKPDYWRRWVKAAKKAAEQHKLDADAAYAEFDNQPESAGTESRKSRRYPIYKSSCITVKPAYYSRTPALTTTRRFEINDLDALTACEVATRLAQYLVDNTRFDDVMGSAVSDFIHADKATGQVIYEAETEEQRVPLFPTMDEAGETEFYTAEGDEHEGEVLQDEQGYFFMDMVAIPETQKVYAAQTCYDEILHTPDAKCEAEIEDKAYYFVMDEDKAKNRFGEKAANIKWKSGKKYGGDERKENEGVDMPGRYVEGWEIWCKRSKQVYWLSDQYQEDFLDVKEDPYGLRGFFPSPAFAIANKPKKSMYPTPLYIDLKPGLDDLHEIAAQIPDMARAARPRALVDGSNTELLTALQELEGGEFVAVKNFQSLVEKGGLGSLVQYLPVQELVAAIQRLMELEQRLVDKFYEWFGVPDILRGTSDPLETAAAQEIKQGSAHDRFKFAKKLIATLARDLIEMMLDLSLRVFGRDKIASIVGLNYMTPEHQQRFDNALGILKNDEERVIRIDIDTDSLSFLDQSLKQQQVNQAAQTVTTGLQTIAQMSSGDPTFIPAGLEVLLTTLEHMDAGRKFTDAVSKTINTLMEAKKNPPEQPPPPPDYEAQKLELQGQKQAIEAQKVAREQDRKDYELQLKAQAQSSELQLAEYKTQLDNTVANFSMQMEAARIQIEEFKAQMQARESEMEEIRLAQEADAKMYQEAVTTAKNTAPAEPQPPQIINVTPPSMPPITVQIDNGKAPSSKRVEVLRDEMGNAAGYQVVEVPENPSIP
jgi:hypothetical protein